MAAGSKAAAGAGALEVAPPPPGSTPPAPAAPGPAAAPGHPEPGRTAGIFFASGSGIASLPPGAAGWPRARDARREACGRRAKGVRGRPHLDSELRTERVPGPGPRGKMLAFVSRDRSQRKAPNVSASPGPCCLPTQEATHALGGRERGPSPRLCPGLVGFPGWWVPGAGRPGGGGPPLLSRSQFRPAAAAAQPARL